MFKTISKNIFSNYVGVFGAIAIAFLLSPFLVHSLGATQYGVWSIISALTGYMALLDLGVGSAIAKYVARFKALKDYKSLNIFIASGLTIMIAVGTMLVLLSPLLAHGFVRLIGFEASLESTIRTLILIASLDICIFVITGVLLAAMCGFQRFEIVNAINLTIAFFRAIFFYYALTNGYGLIAMAVISLIGNSLAAVIFILALRTTQPEVRINLKQADRSSIVSIFNFSRFTFLSMVAMQLVYYSDAFVIGYFMSAAAITYYTIPWSLGEYTNKLTLAVAQTFTPVFSQQDATLGNEAIYQVYLSGTKCMLFISNLLCGGVLIVGYYFLSIWMGPHYAEKCATLLSIMFFTQMVKGPQLLSYSILLATSRHRIFSFYNISFSVLNLALSIILIQHFELIGVAISTAITQVIFYGIITPILASKALNSSLWAYSRDTYLRSIPSTLTLFLMLIFLSERNAPDGYLILIGQALLSAFVYSIVAYYTLLNAEERVFLLNRSRVLIDRIKPIH